MSLHTLSAVQTDMLDQLARVCSGMLYVIDLQTRQLVYASCANLPSISLPGVPAFALVDAGPVGIAVTPAELGSNRLCQAARAANDAIVEHRLELSREGTDQRCGFVLRESIFRRDDAGLPALLLGVALCADQRASGATGQAPPSKSDESSRLATQQAKVDLMNLRGLIETQNVVALAALDPTSCMRLIADGVLAHSVADGVAISLVEEDDFVWQCCSGVASGQEGLRFSKSASPATQAVFDGDMFLNDTIQDPFKINAAVAARVHFQSLVVVPLRDGQRTIGSIAAFSARRHAFPPLVRHNLELLANLLASALKLAREFRAKQDAIAALQSTQEQLIGAREDAEASAKVKAAFLANMSHEIRTPLHGVIGIADILIDSNLTQQQAHYARVLRHSGNALLTLVNDILDLSKIEAGKLNLEQTSFSLHSMVADTVEILATQAREKNLTLRTQIASEVPDWVLGDPGRVGQVLLNLLGNAIKFTDKGGVTVEVSRPREDAPSTVMFVVADTGIGIAPEVQARLFSPFEQADSSTGRRFGGTGLGLSISRRLVDLMGGAVGLSSIPNVGSRFWFALPLALASHEVLQSMATPATTTTMVGHVLVADDNAVNQLVAQKMLASLGLTCQSVSNGNEALQTLRHGRFDVVLMDCQMPQLDGFETTRRIRAQESVTGSHLPIIALTANALTDARGECIEAGMDDYLSKPLKKDVLAQTLRRWLA